MFIQHHFSKHCRRAKPFDFFSLIPCFVTRSRRDVFLPSWETNKHEVSNSGTWEAHSRLLLLSQTTNATNPRICPAQMASHASAQHPDLPTQPRMGLDRIHSRMFNLISFPFWLQGAKLGGGGQTATSGAIQPAYSKVGGLRTSPALQLHFAERKQSRCCSKGVPRGCVCQCIPALGEHAKALALSLGTTGCFTSEPM